MRTLFRNQSRYGGWGWGRGRPQGGGFTSSVLACRRDPGHGQPPRRLQGGPLREHGCIEDAFPTGSLVLYFYFSPRGEPPPPLTRLGGRKGNHFFTRARFINPSCCAVCIVTQSCPTLCNPMDCSTPGSAVRGIFPRQEHWSGLLPCPLPGDLPPPGIEPGSPALQANSLPLSHQGSPFNPLVLINITL